MSNPFKVPMLGLSLRNLVSPPATRRYPAQPRTPFAGTRGHVELDLAACVFCGLCARRCPSKAITVNLKQRTFVIEHLRCIACEVCVEVCTKDSLTMAVDAPRVYTSAEAGPAGKTPHGREERSRPAAQPAAPQPAAA